MNGKTTGVLAGCVLTVCSLGGVSQAIEPSNPNLIPEARSVLNYVASLEGKGTLGNAGSTKSAFAPRKHARSRTATISRSYHRAVDDWGRDIKNLLLAA